MLNKIILGILIVSIVLISGCQINDGIENKRAKSGIQVYTYCEDNVVCYWKGESWGYSGGAGLFCFRDDDLVKKYCDEKLEEGLK